MKHILVKTCLSFTLIALLAVCADAQRGGRRRPPAGGNNPADTTKPNVQQNNNQPPVNYNPTANIPIIYDTASAATDIKKSLRNENAFDKSSLTQRTPLPYEHLRWDDALFAEKVWRELDLREKMNKVFQYEAEDDNGSQVFMNILLKAVASGEVTAFDDERFTTPLTVNDIQMKTAGSLDTVAQTNINDPTLIDKYIVTRTSFDPKSVMKIRIKEEWVFDRESSRMFCRILGICPLKIQYAPNGKERGVTPMFWIYYPDIRSVLTRYEVYNPKNMGQSRMTWEELFESRMFSSYVIKSTMDNPGNKNIRAYIKDPILALLEGDNIKEKMFNFEQDLWSY
ncbi:MAG TPA: gliding motility protein GldN [Chitinophagaceae bacterium]|nr:gliding motility protein GldN [Chitinophagaceae bacterium]HRG91787.1 gliding motility protein GldN [Chitinophagaceae bacterium]